MKKNNKAPAGVVLNKYIADAGITSRRKAVDLVKQGHVTVQGKLITDPSYKVTDEDKITVDGKVIATKSKLYLLMNKPVGVVSTVSDEKQRKTVIDLLGPKYKKIRLYPVGRLDYDTSGLIIITNDGNFAQRLAHPRNRVTKVYQVTLDKPVFPAVMQQIKSGILLSDGLVKVDAISYLQEVPANQVIVTLHSGKYRVVRRLFEKLDFMVKKLERIEYAGLTKQGLRVGAVRHLTRYEIAKLQTQGSVPNKK